MVYDSTDYLMLIVIDFHNKLSKNIANIFIIHLLHVPIAYSLLFY